MNTKLNNEEIAHVYRDSNDEFHIQTIFEHSVGTSKLASEFASEFAASLWGELVGLYHDIGKHSADFQQYICYRSGYKAECEIGKVDHSSVGSILCKKQFPGLYPVLSACIAGHHSGLLDYQSLCERLEKQYTDQFPSYAIDTSKIAPPQGLSRENFHLWVRMLFSCLVDADYLDTERFMKKEAFEQRTNQTSIEELKKKLDDFLQSLQVRAKDTALNKIRQQIQDECFQVASENKGFFSLTVPTGGGKTISSMVWAINHAVIHGHKRIIIAIPYTSIIVQTASVLREIFGDENVLEHHSNLDETQREKLAAENWDAPIVLTTNVQLFESLFANRTSKCRKLHNICNSILILDEAQTLPPDFLLPILDSLNALQSLFGVSVLFTTASLPAITGEISNGRKEMFCGISHVREIVADVNGLSEKLRRVSITIRSSRQSYDEISADLSSHLKVLCVVNSRREAQEIYSRLPQEGNVYHLSRMMCSAHIQQTICEVKQILMENTSDPLRVISTQLIEAGVDIDFPVVFRQEAGLDSILQAAGRCNREGKLLKPGEVVVFQSETPPPPGSLLRGCYAFQELDKTSDWLSPVIMKQYFAFFYGKASTFDKEKIKELLYCPPYWNFATAADRFKLINESGYSIIVNWGKSREAVEELKKQGANRYTLRKLQPYSVTVNEKDFKALCKFGRIEEIIEGIWVQSDPNLYDYKVGLKMDNHWLEETYII